MYFPLNAASFLALIVSANAHVVDGNRNLHTPTSPRWSAAGTVESPEHGALEGRSGATCGPSANNAVCASNLCCGPNGVCGTGAYYCVAPSCLFQYGPACDANQTPPGVNTTSVPRPKLGNTPYGVSIRDCGIPGKVALTFDDGPYIYTAALLDILKSKGVKATFFLVGNNGGKGQINDPKTGYPALIQRMYNEGHQIGSHTWSHADLSTLTRQQRYDQVVKNEIALTDILGFFPTYLRPPYESCNADCLNDLRDLGYHVANYDIDTLDWQGDYGRSQSIFSSGLKSASSGHGVISLAHDIHDKTVHTLAAYMIDTLHAAGFTTALYGECMSDPPENWYRNSTTGQPYTAGIFPNTSTVTIAKSASSSSNSTTTNTIHTSGTASTPTPSAVDGGEGAFGSRTGNTTSTGATSSNSKTDTLGTITIGQSASGGVTKLSNRVGRHAELGLTWGLLSWMFLTWA